MQKAARLVLGKPREFSLATREVHAHKPRIAAALAEFCLVLKAMQCKFKTFGLKLHESHAEIFNSFVRSVFRIWNHE